MKTTFREAFCNIDNEFLSENIEIDNNTDIDIEKIKVNVLSRTGIKDTKKPRAKKSLKMLLIAAALVVFLLVGTTAIYATGGLEYIFNQFFGGDLNSVGLYNSEKVNIISGNDKYNINLLGITGDDKKIYAAIEVTNKDGSPFTDEGFNNAYHILSPEESNEKIDYENEENAYKYFGATFECKSSDGTEPERCNGTVDYKLSEDRKVLTMYVLAMNGDENVNLKDGTMHFYSDRFGGIKILEKIATRVDYEIANKMGAKYGWDKEWSEIEKRVEEAEASLDKQGITDYMGMTVGDDKCIVQREIYPLSFEMEFELNYETNKNIIKTVTIKDAPDFIDENALEVKMEITPFGVNMYGKCDPAIVSESVDEDYCYKDFDYSKTSKIILEDGTEYHLYRYGLDTEGEKDGCYIEEKTFNLSTVSGAPHYKREINLIDPQEVKTVIINGNTVYEK